jgi:hypothetical protein
MRKVSGIVMRAAVRRVRIGADQQLAGQRVQLGHHRVREAFRAGVAGVSGLQRLQITVVLQDVAIGEVAVRARQALGAEHRECAWP